MPVTLDQYINFGQSTVGGGAGGLGTALNPADTTLNLPTGHGARFPASGSFKLQLGTTGIAKCTSRTGDVLTLVRGVNLVGLDNTAADPAWPLGTTVQFVVTAQDMLDLAQGINNGREFMVEDYGAVGDGVTDDTAAIQAAINAANSNGGGRIKFGPKTYITTTLTFYSYCHFAGSGIQATRLKLKNGANADLLQGFHATSLINGAAANGTSSPTDGANNWSIQNMTLDGNMANQTSGPSWCLRVYGYGHIVDNVRIKNGFSGCVQTDWNGGNGAGDDQMEAHWSNVKIHSSGGPGLQWFGPHDSQVTNVIIYDNNDTTLVSTGKLTPGLHVGPNCAGFLGTNVHVWNTNLAFLIEGSVSNFVNCVAEGTARGSNPSTCIAIYATMVRWDGWVFGSSGSESTTTGVVLGLTAGATPLSPYMIRQSAGLTTAQNAKQCDLSLSMQECQVAAINYLNDGGQNHISATIKQSAGTYFIGSPNSDDDVELFLKGTTDSTTVTYAATSTVTAQNLTATNTVTGASVAVNGAGGSLKITGTGRADPASDTTIRLIRSTTASTLDAVMDSSGMRFIKNSGSVYTPQVTIDGSGDLTMLGALSVGQSASAAATATSGTIATAGVTVARISPAGAITGVILASGTVAGQICTVVNEAIAANSCTFAAAGTSHVADGVASVIAGLNARAFIWDSGTSLWYPCK